MRVFNTYAALQKALDLPEGRKTAFRFKPEYAPAAFLCSECKETIAFPFNSCATGYGLTGDKGKESFVCYDCCGKQDRARMIESGKACLYLTMDGETMPRRHASSGKVGNWPNSLSFPVRYVSKGFHNIARVRFDFWFNGPDGFVWHGYSLGHYTQIAHCKRTKERWQAIAA